jgi:hypothetical protein
MKSLYSCYVVGTHAMHSFLLRGDNAPQGTASGAPLTVEYLLDDCTIYRKHTGSIMPARCKWIFIYTVSVRKMADFKKEIHFHCKLWCPYLFYLNILCWEVHLWNWFARISSLSSVSNILVFKKTVFVKPFLFNSHLHCIIGLAPIAW